jgi:DNA-binding CsgD family transcriptional regulator
VELTHICGALSLHHGCIDLGLTPAELRVLFAIIEVGNVPEVAAVLGLSQSTVKTYLHRLFEKTGTHRQAELVKLVAGYSHAVLH